MMRLAFAVFFALSLAVWLAAAGLTHQPLAEALSLVAAQGMLAIMLCLLYAWSKGRWLPASGPTVATILICHTAVYYGVSNLVPALLPDLRPESIAMLVEYRISPAPPSFYIIGTLSAVLFVMAFCTGARAVLVLPVRLVPPPTRVYLWLPSCRFCVMACAIFLFFVLWGTARYSSQFVTGAMTSEAMAELCLVDQLVFHGLLYFLPIAPLLSAAALLQSAVPRNRRWIKLLLAGASVTTFLALATWGMRSTAMIAIMLPIALLSHAGAINWRRAVLSCAVLLTLIYSLVTYVRHSELSTLLAETTSLRDLTIANVADSLRQRRVEEGVLEHFVGDLSYRVAGLEAAAALLQAQREDRLFLQFGRVTLAGFKQALPSSFRPEFEIAARVKTAPSHYGIFQSGDWVTTVLAEQILDFGPYFLVVPAAIAGFFMALIDRALLVLGRLEILQGLLVLRLAFFTFIVSNGGSLADISLLFFKATIGYTALLVFLGLLSTVFRPFPSR